MEDIVDIRAHRSAPGREAAADTLSELLRRARPRVFRWALVKTGDADEAEDVAQEVSIRLAKRPPTIAGGSLWPWLYRVTSNVVIDRGRARARSRSADVDEIHELPDATGDALEALVGAETRDALRRFMETLSPRQREVLQLVDVDGFSSTEAADMMGIDAATARVHLLRARRTLRSRLLEMPDDL